MYTFRCAYRFDDGAIEGFSGFGFSEYGARKDCREQIRRKLSAIPNGSPDVVEGRVIYDQRAVSPDIDDPRAATPDEMECIRRDWARSHRYDPHGNLYAN
jgi:hypothetical protein